MWFKLAGATFTNNLGTMDSISKSYMMDYSGLTGLSASPGSVSYASDSTPDATITFTVKSGYVFKSGSKVTASGGASKTYTASTDIVAGSSFTMALTGISNKVTFVGAAELVSGGNTGGSGGSEPDVPVNPPSGATALTLANYPTTKGIATSGTGVWSTTATALQRRTAFVPVDGYSQIKLTHDASKYKYNLVFYNYNYTSSSQMSGGSSSGKADAYISDLGGWQETSPFTHTLPSGAKSIAIGVATASGTTLNTAATLADEFTSINLIDAQGNKTSVNLSDYSTHIGICSTGSGIWSNTTDISKLRKSAFVNVEGYTQVEFVFDDTAYKLNVVSYNTNITKPSDITATGAPAAKNAYISDLGGWQETSPFTKEIPENAKCVLIGVARVDGSENTASTLAEEFTSIELS